MVLCPRCITVFNEIHENIPLLKTISIVDIFKFRTVLALTCSFGSYAYQELPSGCTKE
jgi:tryptophan 2,3-dioxygenase